MIYVRLSTKFKPTYFVAKSTIWTPIAPKLDRSYIKQHALIGGSNRASCLGPTPLHSPDSYKPGGTFMISSGDLTGRVIAQKHEKWGRWVSQVYQGKGSTKKLLYSAFQIVAKDVKLGCITTASQQQSLLIQANDPNTNPRSAFWRDITLALQASLADGHEMLLLGDFNEAFGSNIDGIHKVASICGLLYLMSICHSSTPRATYAWNVYRYCAVLPPWYLTHNRVLAYRGTIYCFSLLQLSHHHLRECPDVNVRCVTSSIRDSKLNANPNVILSKFDDAPKLAEPTDNRRIRTSQNSGFYQHDSTQWGGDNTSKLITWTTVFYLSSTSSPTFYKFRIPDDIFILLCQVQTYSRCIFIH